MTRHGRCSDAMLKTVREALALGPGSERQIWERVDCWAPQTITFALKHLVELGEAIIVRQPIPSGYRNIYRKAMP